MVQPREWSEANLTILIENPGLSDQMLAHKLPGHPVEDIAIVRDTLHLSYGGSNFRGQVMEGLED